METLAYPESTMVRTLPPRHYDYSRPIPLLAIVLMALVVHGPLLLMQLPAGSFDANFHMFFASNYAQHLEK